jgi:hypothetical protein
LFTPADVHHGRTDQLLHGKDFGGRRALVALRFPPRFNDLRDVNMAAGFEG